MRGEYQFLDPNDLDLSACREPMGFNEGCTIPSKAPCFDPRNGPLRTVNVGKSVFLLGLKCIIFAHEILIAFCIF